MNFRLCSDKQHKQYNTEIFIYLDKNKVPWGRDYSGNKNYVVVETGYLATENKSLWDFIFHEF